MDIYKQFKTDKQAEEEGTWVPLSATARLKIARIGNPRYALALKRCSQPYVKPGMRLTDVDDETYTTITKHAVAEAILLDWEGVLRDGQPLPYSKEAAIDAFEMKDFYELVLNLATSMETFRVARLETLAKNS